jgi:HK97 family phage prohead protease
MNAEIRYLPLAESGLEVEERDDAPPRIAGVAPPWNSWSVDLGGFKERFMPGAFRKWLDRKPTDPRGPADVVAKFNHSDLHVLGRTTNGTLELSETDRGLAFRATPPAGTPTTAEVLALIRGKYIHGSSFAFSISDPAGESWDADPAGNVTRTIGEAALFDVSPVTHAAYPSSSVGLRSVRAFAAARGVALAAEKTLTVSIDYDDTFSAAPGMWRSWILDAATRGHRILCISRREDTDANRGELLVAFQGLPVDKVILCGPKTQKRAAAQAAGLEVDVWIDDRPEAIPDSRATARDCEVPHSGGQVFRGSLLGAKAAAAAAVARMRAHAG